MISKNSTGCESAREKKRQKEDERRETKNETLSEQEESKVHSDQVNTLSASERVAIRSGHRQSPTKPPHYSPPRTWRRIHPSFHPSTIQSPVSRIPTQISKAKFELQNRNKNRVHDSNPSEQNDDAMRACISGSAEMCSAER